MREDIMHTVSRKLAFARLASVVFLLVGPLLGPVRPSTPVASAQPEEQATIAEEAPIDLPPQSAAASPQAPAATTYWTIETVDPGSGVGLFSSLAIDSSDDLHVGYYETTSATLRYAVFTDTTWMTTTVDSVADVGQYASLALDSNDLPRISYYDATSTALRYARKEAGWIESQVDNTASVGQYTSLAFDGTTPLISYYDATSSTLKLAWYDDTPTVRAWISETVDAGPDVGQYTAIDIASYPHIVYYDAGNDQLKYVKGTSSGWNFSDGPVNHSGEGGRFTSLALDSNNHPHVSYFSSLDEVVYAYHDGNAWWDTVIATAGSEATMHTSIVVDADDVPHIAYTDNVGSGHLTYAYLDGSTWVTETIESANVEGYPSIALDSGGLPHITYSHADGLKHAWLRPCIAPTSLTIDGPSTVYAGSGGTFTATVGPPTTTVPLTVTWSYPMWEGEFVDVVTTTEAVRSFGFNDLGTYTLTVTAENCGGLIEETHALTVESPPAPDLIVTDIWEDAGRFWYQVQNVGAISATAHHDGLTVDGADVSARYVYGLIGPTERYSRPFTYDWTCTGISDTVRVSADINGVIDEWNESNNYREEDFLCDTEPPVFVSGPDVVSTDLYTAVIEWETDEPTEGYVWYGLQPGYYAGSEHDPTFGTTHRVTLTGLSNLTTYAILVGAFDPSGNETYSDDFFLTTLEPIASPPDGVLTVEREGSDTLVLSFNTYDPSHADRVEFYIDDDYVATDYTPDFLPDDPDGEYEFGFRARVPSLGWTRDDYYADHLLEARVFSPYEMGYTTIDLYGPSREDMPYDLEIRTPHDNQTFSIETNVVPAGTTFGVNVDAIAYEWECGWDHSLNEGPYTTPPDCGDVAQPMPQLDLIVLDSSDTEVYHVSTNPVDFTPHFSWDMGGLAPDTYTVRVEATLPDDSVQYREHTFHLVREEPSITLRRNVEVIETGGSPAIHVELTVINEEGATGSAEILRIKDWAQELQPIQADMGDYTVDTYYTTYGYLNRVAGVIVEFDSPLVLLPGVEYTIEYDAIPILYESGPSDFGVGTEDVEVKYTYGGTWTTEHFYIPQYLPYYTTDSFLYESDYIIVTNPARLRELSPNADEDVDALLSTMARLAWRKNGVLGYLETYAGSHAVLDDLVEPGGYWSESLAPEFQNVGEGYMLLVGEIEVIPAWVSLDFHICWAAEGDSCDPEPDDVYDHDQWYANTEGAGMPDLVVGRAIGNNPAELAQVLETSLGVYEGRTWYNFDQFDSTLEDAGRALLVSGEGEGVSDFRDNVETIADALDDDGWVSQHIIHWEDVPAADDTDVFISNVSSRDFIYFSGHGNVDFWGPGLGTGDFPLDFVYHNPFVLAPTCLSGNYERGDDYNIAEAFFDNGAGVYIGSTEISPVPMNIDAGESFVYQWNDNEALGHNLLQFERDIWNTDSHYEWFRFWAYEYNFYGDPKYGHHYVSTRGAVPTASRTVTTSLHVQVPDYQVTTTVDGFDLVSIPGAINLVDPGWYDVPVYMTSLEYPAGVRVQHVDLITRTGYSLTVGLNIPTNTVFHTPYVETNPTEPIILSPLEDEAWFPAPDRIYDWTTTDNPDGSTTLDIQLFPFHYNYLTTFGEFYSDFEFAIDVITTGVSIDGMVLDQAAYALGDPVAIDAWVSNSGAAEDVVIYASVLEVTTEEVAGGLDLRTLYGLAGPSAVSFEWDSTGVPAGSYIARVEVYDFDGTLLDSAMEEFQLGIASAEATALGATPRFFEVGDPIDISMTISNTGPSAVSGEAIVKVFATGVSTPTAVFSQTVTDLASGNAFLMNEVWDTTATTEEEYRVIGYMKYDSRTTEVETAVVSTRAYIYLPLVLRD
jgi:hypothetical protein